MTNRHQQVAEKIVATFKQSLSENAAQQVSDAQFNTLILMIREAMGEEASFAAEQLEQVIRKLRAESEKPDLGM
jgi:hypothetical protein